jgi:hypothetical protein
MTHLFENNIVNQFKGKLQADFDTNIAFKEFSAGYGIADLVYAKNFIFNKNALKRTPINNYFALKIFLSLKDHRTYKTSEIYSLFNYLSKNQIYPQLEFLQEHKYLNKLSKYEYIKTINNKELNPIKKIIAIEVKLNDHRNGLIQAKRYQYFADECYLAILKKKKIYFNIKDFEANNIGVILLDDKTGRIEYKLKPKKISATVNIFNLFAKELLLKNYLSLNF